MFGSLSFCHVRCHWPNFRGLLGRPPRILLPTRKHRHPLIISSKSIHGHRCRASDLPLAPARTASNHVAQSVSMASRQPEATFQCDQCTMCFSNYQSLTLHKAAKHHMSRPIAEFIDSSVCAACLL